MRVATTQIVDLDESAVKQVFNNHLQQLTQGRWVRDGKLWDEAATSHRFDVEVGDHTHPDYNLVLAVQQLKTAINDRRK